MKNSIESRINPGFSLIEVLIAIFLIGVAFVGVVAFFNSSLQSHFDAKNELIAAGLAQEGSELIRNLRDYKVLHDNASWTDLVNATSGLPRCKRTDYKTLTSSNHACYDSSVNEYICLNNQGRYEQCASGATGTGFKREISVSCENSNNNIINCSAVGNVKSLMVVSTVTWGTDDERSTEATDRLYENEY